jgi:RecB family exonuclease
MPLTLVLGPANSAKAGEVLGAYAAAARRGALLVVPTIADADHYDRELAGDGVALGRALTFAGLIGEIAERVGYDAPRLTSVQRRRLVRRTLASLELPALGAAAASPGLIRHAGNLIAELRRARVPGPRFAAALRAWAGDDPARVAYAADLVAIPLRYAELLGRLGRVDQEEFAYGALDAARAVRTGWDVPPIFVYGFDDLTEIERDAIETLSSVAEAHVTVSLTYEPGRPALAARGPLVEALRGIATSARELISRDDHYDPGARAALHHLERSLFEPGASRIDPGDAVALLEAGGERTEAELVAAEVSDALAAGVPASEIVVVCRSLARSGALVERALARAGIASGSDRRVPLGHTALGRGLLALARLAFDTEASAADLLVYLRTPGVAATSAMVDRLERLVRRRGLQAASAALAAAARELPEIDLPEIAALRGATDAGAELARSARRLLAGAHGARAPVLTGAEELDARAAAAVLDGLAELHELEPGLPGGELLTALAELEVAAGARAALAGQDGGRVLIAEPLAIRARRFRRVLICGLCEAEFPAVGEEDPFLGDEGRHELALASGLALPVERDPLARERYLFYACASRATERLVLSYRSSDEEGNLVLPSPFLADVAALFDPEWFARRRRRLLADVVWPVEEAPTEAERRLSLAALAGERAPAEPADPATVWLGARALDHVRHREVVSGGALENFAQCPVRWLVDAQLSPDGLEPDDLALVRGSFMHEVLERVIADLSGPLTAESLPAAERRVAELTASPPVGLAPGSAPEVRRALLRGIEADLRRYLRHAAFDGCDWTPHAVELRFGIEGDHAAGQPAAPDQPAIPALRLESGDQSVMVRGVIDRIDVDRSGRRAIVRDYKSGSNRPERAASKWLAGAQFQVALYMLAVRRLLDLEPVAGLYQPLTGGDLRARGAVLAGVEAGTSVVATDRLEAAELEALLAEIEQAAVELVGTVRRGELTPSPGTCSRDGCLHPGICWAVR